MLNQANQIIKVLQSNFKQQIQLFDSIRKAIEKSSQPQQKIDIVVANYEMIQTQLSKWRALYEQNKILLQKYMRFAQIHMLQTWQKLETAISTQIYIEQAIQKTCKKWPNDIHSQFLIWSALQKYNCTPIITIS